MLSVVGQFCFERPSHCEAGLGQEPTTSVEGHDLANGCLGRADELGRLEGSNGVADTDVGDGRVGVVHCQRHVSRRLWQLEEQPVAPGRRAGTEDLPDPHRLTALRRVVQLDAVGLASCLDSAADRLWPAIDG